jgi:crotonobetainyl-CoA:carnitine CoA-transferase CaiB-like acyl-CoA transferase
MLYVNERFNSQAHEVDTNGEPVSLGSAESPIVTLADGTMVTIAASPIFTPLFPRFCAMMRRTDLLDDPRFATAHLRRQNHKDLLEVIRTWMLTFNQVRDLETQVRVSGLALGVLRTTEELLDTPWGEYRKPMVEIDDGAGGKIRVPKPAWLFSEADLELPTNVARRGEDNSAVLSELGWSAGEIAELTVKKVLLSDPPRSELAGADASSSVLELRAPQPPVHMPASAN